MTFDPKQVFASFSTTFSTKVCDGATCILEHCDFMQAKGHPKPYLKHVEATIAKRKQTVVKIMKKPVEKPTADAEPKPTADVEPKPTAAEILKKPAKKPAKTPKKNSVKDNVKIEIKPKKADAVIKHQVKIGFSPKDNKPVVYFTTSKPCHRGLGCVFVGCKFDHPMCPSGKKCSKTICNGKGHVARRPCRKGLDCDYNGCIFEHPTCVDGNNCRTIYCPGVHPNGYVPVCTNENRDHVRDKCKFRHVKKADRRLMKK